MCDYMYYERKQRAKVKNPLPETEPELERIWIEEEVQEEQPVTLKA